jgi:hypothetical protein
MKEVPAPILQLSGLYEFLASSTLYYLKFPLSFSATANLTTHI